MIEINVDFIENYKKLDNLIKDMYATKDGVTTYINEMENVSYKLRSQFVDWESTYKNLKHMRWVRNQLSHNIGAFKEEICTQNDIEWIKYFYKSLMDCDDCLTNINKAIKSTKEYNRRKLIINDNLKANDFKGESRKITFTSRIKLFLKRVFKKHSI